MVNCLHFCLNPQTLKFNYWNTVLLFCTRDQIHQTVFNDIYQVGWHFIWEIQWKWRNAHCGNIKSFHSKLWQKVAVLTELRSGTCTLCQSIVLISHWMGLPVCHKSYTRDVQRTSFLSTSRPQAADL